ncbi:hypothetical protein [Chitinibacter tainanensis]|uniref:hypothetical protein n=1 Tax=Chitinibacter tainanensis TaxID=230667 RepID=UPI002355D1C1|nr:hypothetical protein [Chitinibacter tainanensis]
MTTTNIVGGGAAQAEFTKTPAFAVNNTRQDGGHFEAEPVLVAGVYCYLLPVGRMAVVDL